MVTFGDALRKAREAKGLTVSQVAEKTRVLVQIVEDMERNDFHRIKAPIYGRGFIKLICECLEIEPAPLIGEFMDIYTGRLPPAATDPFHARTAEPAPAEPVALETTEEPAVPDATETDAEPLGTHPDATVETPPETVRGLELFDPQPRESATSAAAPQASSARDVSGSFNPFYDPPARPASHGAAEKFRASLSAVSHGVIGTVERIPRSAWRIATLAAGAVAVAVLLVWGCTILYKATGQSRPEPADPGAAETKPSAENAAVSKKAPAKKVELRQTGQKVPPLYID